MIVDHEEDLRTRNRRAITLEPEPACLDMPHRVFRLPPELRRRRFRRVWSGIGGSTIGVLDVDPKHTAGLTARM